MIRNAESLVHGHTGSNATDVRGAEDGRRTSIPLPLLNRLTLYIGVPLTVASRLPSPGQKPGPAGLRRRRPCGRGAPVTAGKQRLEET
jgi:hypothetical protein